MSTANRLKNRAKNTSQTNSTSTPITTSNRSIQQPQSKFHKKYDSNNHSQQKQKQYEAYYQLSQCNPQGITYTNSIFPHNAQMFNSYSLPLGFVLSPLLVLQNQQAPMIYKSGDKIPKCQQCRAYMNCYNKINKNVFTCFLCNRQNSLPKDYNIKDNTNQEFSSSIYQCYSPTNYYPKQPAQQTFVLMIDITPQSANTRMLYYAVSAMKQVLSRPQLDDLCIYFFTFDEMVQQYDFSGSDIKCVINDQTIQGQPQIKLDSYYLKDIREKLFQLLDALQQISTNNPRRGSNFHKCFTYIYNALKHTSAKFFILQSNQLIAGQQLFKQQIIKKPNQTINTNQPQKIQSLYQTKNKQFFQKFANSILENNCSISFFTFSRNYKNLKAIHDVLKLSSSQLKVYIKDSTIQLQKFYYQLMYLLGTNYFKNIRMDCIINTGWHFTAVYGNFYRLKQYIIFQINWLEQSRKIVVLVSPTTGQYNPSYCSIQFVTNYQYKRQSFMSVSTIIQPVTGYLDRLYKSVDQIVVSNALSKGFLSSLRMQQINNARKKLLQVSSSIYSNALQFHKKSENIPDSIISIIMYCLSLLKSTHAQPQSTQNTIIFDKILSQRNFIQFSSIPDIYNIFNPYLFDLVNLDETMCRQDVQFIYPNTIQARFQNVRDGLFLLDAGTALYLFIAKNCDPNILNQVFGKPKLQKNDELTQQIIMNQSNFRSNQIQTLIKFLRQQKAYGWIPLYIVKCGQNTVNQRNFYLFFYGQKYQEYRAYKMSLEEFIAIISKPISF